MARFEKADEGKPRLSLIPKAAMWAMARAMGYGTIKYPEGNWRLCDDPRRYLDATLRHLYAWAEGEEWDESGLSHLDHALASLAFLVALVARDGLQSPPKTRKRR